MVEMVVEKVKIVELTLKDGSKILCRGGEDAVYRAWNNYPVVSAKWTGEEDTMQWLVSNNQNEESGGMAWVPE